MSSIPKMNSMAGVGVCAGRLKRLFMACTSIRASSCFSPFSKFHDSAFDSRLGILTFSCSSRSTAVSIWFMTSFCAIVFILIVDAFILFILISRFFAFLPSLVSVSPRYL